MKRQDKTKLMLGQILEPVAQDTSYARYRLDRLVASEVGKRTFLATALNSYTDLPVGSPAESQVIVKLLLFGPDFPDEEYLQPTDALPFDLPVSLPYLESFEVETPLGAGLVLVKPYADMFRSETSQSSGNSQAKSYAESVTANASQALSSADFSDYAPAQSDGAKAAATSRRAYSRSSDAVAPAAPQQFSQVRWQDRSLAALPLTQPIYSVFRIRQTPQKLEVRFPEARVSEGLLLADSDATRTESVELWLSVVLALVVFVGGTVALTGSIWGGVVIAALLPVVFHLLVGRGDRPNHTATLRITDESEGRAFVSLTTTSPPIRDRNGNINGAPSQSQLHGSRLSIKEVQVSHVLRLVPGQSPLMAQISFSFHNPPAHCKRLRIVGSYQEMRWLSHHFAQWGHARNQTSALQK